MVLCSSQGIASSFFQQSQTRHHGTVQLPKIFPPYSFCPHTLPKFPLNITKFPGTLSLADSKYQKTHKNFIPSKPTRNQGPITKSQIYKTSACLQSLRYVLPHHQPLELQLPQRTFPLLPPTWPRMLRDYRAPEQELVSLPGV